MIKDHREIKNMKPEPYGFVVFTDRFMSGWGQAPGRSLYALAVDSEDEALQVLRNGKRRSDMKRGRFVKTLDNVKLGPGDHLSITDKHNAERWYEPDAFAD